MSLDRMKQAALALMKLGVSQAGVTELLGRHPLEVVEAQLSYLPYRKARRPEAFIIQAVRNNYAKPKELYAAHHPKDSNSQDVVDQNPESDSRSEPTDTERY